MDVDCLASNLHLLRGAVNTGMLVSGGQALLLDCGDTVTPERLLRHGVEAVEMILCTQYRRTSTAGVYPFIEQGAQVIIPAGERELFEQPGDYWNAWACRWHLYSHRPGPMVPAHPIPGVRGVREPETIEWQGYVIHVIDTPGATDGSVSYVVEVDDERFCFCGDAIFAPGMLWDLHSLQKGHDGLRDYHGFVGNRRALIDTLEKLGDSGIDVLVPSHGEVMEDPAGACQLLVNRLDGLWHNYTSMSSINHYFPDVFTETADDPACLLPAEAVDLPSFLRRVSGTSFGILSDSGAMWLSDCGNDAVVNTLWDWQEQGEITGVEGCWVSHYHDDHVDSLHRLKSCFDCPIVADEHMAEIIEHPGRFYLPCISPVPAPVDRVTRSGESWQWQEFTLTAYHLPGQTLYHGGLLIEGHGRRVLLAGDNFSPTGLDDYCAPNRCFLSNDKGFFQCLHLLQQIKPDCILNAHQPDGFVYGDEQIEIMLARLSERKELLGSMLPWSHVNFGLDEWWVRCYPYEQEISAGAKFCVQVQFTNHSHDAAEARVQPVLPDGWNWDEQRSAFAVEVPPRTDGIASDFCQHPDKAVRIWITAGDEAQAGLYVIPFRISWAGQYLGQFRHALVRVR